MINQKRGVESRFFLWFWLRDVDKKRNVGCNTGNQTFLNSKNDISVYRYFYCIEEIFIERIPNKVII
jgi:hypothetical protein